jgi:pyruvate carboxylase subunit B
MLEPEMEKAKEATKDIAKDIGDVLIYTLYPTTGMRFLRWKYGLEEPPSEVKPKTLEDVKREDEIIAKAKAGLLVERAKEEIPKKGPGLRTFNVFVEDEYYKVEVEGVSERPAATGVPLRARVAPPVVPPRPAERREAPSIAPTLAPGEVAIVAPMPGIVIRYEVEVGDRVKAGDAVVIIEAMKMQNSLPSPIDGTVKAINFHPGNSVKKGDVLAVIG